MISDREATSSPAISDGRRPDALQPRLRREEAHRAGTPLGTRDQAEIRWLAGAQSQAVGRVGGQTRRLQIEVRGEQLERGLGDPALGALLILAGAQQRL